ncbi:MAG TPA: glycosyltransferase family 4 protein, partial [Acidimicrobiales bacterium]|nr:glycosyltransferase family 4 protein [Acidimicrobiales bacterium]
MRLLVLCPHFAPDTAPTGEVMTSIAAELAARGHELHVVTSLPWYRQHRIEPGWEGSIVRHEDRPWGRVTRVHPFPTDKGSIPARAVGFAGFTALSSAMGVAGRRADRPDAVLAMSPPLTLGGAGWLAARRWDVPFVFNVQDVFPDVAVEVGAITNPQVVRLASWLERWSYRRADAVTVLSEDLKGNLVAKIRGTVPDADDRIRVIPNFVDTARITPRPPEEGTYRHEHGLEGRRVVMYAGNVGWSQALDLVLAAARTVGDRPDATDVR